MATDLNARLQAYLGATELHDPEWKRAGAGTYADALLCSKAATAAATASLICSHVRELRGGPAPSFVPAGRNELDFLMAQKSGARHDEADGQDPVENAGEEGDAAVTVLPLPTGHDSIAAVVSGAAGVVSIKELSRKYSDA